MKILNQGKREIHGATLVDFTHDELGNRVYAKDENGKTILPIPFVLKPNTALDFDVRTGTYMKKLFPKELVTFEDLQRRFDGTMLAAAPTPAQIDHHAAAAPAAAPGLVQHSDLSPEELAVIARMRAGAALPLVQSETLPQEPKSQSDAPDSVSKDPDDLSEAELEALTAPGAERKKSGLIDRVKTALHSETKGA